MAVKKHTTTELKIVFDTNVLHNQSANELVRLEIAQLLTDNANHEDLKLSWFIPETVKLERRYQMLAKATELMPSIRKMEMLLSHNLNITEEIIRDRVDAHIATQLTGLGLAALALDTTAVDWNRVLHDATSRVAPFESGETEKGFRDLLVGEAFIQLAKSSPTTPKLCRVILVSGDKRLREMVSKRAGDQQNVKLFSSIEGLRGFINTLASDVSEEFVNKYRAAAKALFYTVDDQGALWVSKKVEQEIRRRFEVQLATPPADATTVEQGQWNLASPEFVKKKKQRIHWSSRFTIPLTAFRYETDPGLFMAGSAPNVTRYPTVTLSSVGSDIDVGSAFNRYGNLAFFRSDPAPVTFTAVTHSGMRRIEVRTGRALVDVQWSVTVRTNGTLTSPTVDEFSFVGTTWT